MKLGTFSVSTSLGPVRRLGVHTPAGIVDATAARQAWLERIHTPQAAARLAQAQVPPDLLELLYAERHGIEWVREAVDHALASDVTQTSSRRQVVYQPEEIQLLAPIPRPTGISAFMTFAGHIRGANASGANMKFPDKGSDLLAYFKQNPESVLGDGAVLTPPPFSKELDVECEFAAIVGRTIKNASVEEARDAIAGYTIFNDVSIDRGIQIREMSFGLGCSKTKDHDGGNILGPWLVTPDEVGNPRALRMSFHVNGKEMSSASTDDMVWDHAELLSYLSRGQTIHPGHVVSSGSYHGGCAHDVGIKLQDGDRTELRISTLGSLHNTIQLN